MRKGRMSGNAVQTEEKNAAGDVFDVDRNPSPPIVTGSCARAVVDGQMVMMFVQLMCGT